MDPSQRSQEIWEEFSLSFIPAVREVVGFAKKIPGFRDLSEYDQVSILKNGTFEVRIPGLSDTKNRSFPTLAVVFQLNITLSLTLSVELAKYITVCRYLMVEYQCILTQH